MNDLIHIGNSDITIKEYSGQRVVTFKDIDAVHGRPDGTANKRFLDNKKRFVKDEDYFIISNSEIRKSHIFPISDNDFTDKTLITEQGYLMLVKSFTDDLAWDVQRQLVNTYFKAKKETIDRKNLSSNLQIVYAMLDAQAKQELEQKRLTLEVEKVRKEQDFIKETFASSSEKEDFKAWVNSCIAKIAESPKFTNGTTRSMRYTNARTESYERLKKKRNCNLNDRVQRAQGRAIQQKPSISKAELNAINKLSVIADDKDLRNAYDMVIKEMMICYCITEKAEV